MYVYSVSVCKYECLCFWYECVYIHVTESIIYGIQYIYEVLLQHVVYVSQIMSHNKCVSVCVSVYECQISLFIHIHRRRRKRHSRKRAERKLARNLAFPRIPRERGNRHGNRNSRRPARNGAEVRKVMGSMKK